MASPKQILELAEKYEKYTVSNLSKLIKIRSMSGEESAAAAELKKMMEEADFDEVRIDGIGNVIGRIGNGKKVIAIDGHLDTVDSGSSDNWEFDPFCGEIKDGFVHGRGSVDQKGGVASFITAGKITKELGLTNDVTIYFTGSVIEETCEGLCWKHIIENESIKPDCVIVTEPTNLNIARGQKGRMEIDISFFGKSSHGSAPEKGENAIYTGSKIALEIEKLNERLMSDPFLGKGSVTVTDITSKSPSLCAVPDYCRIHLDRRLTNGEDKNIAIEQIEKIAANINSKIEMPENIGTAYTGLNYTSSNYFPAWVVDENHPVINAAVKCYKNLFNSEPEIDKWVFSTNGVSIKGIFDIPVVGFGPGDESQAHSPNERVPIEQLVKASAFYANFIESY